MARPVYADRLRVTTRYNPVASSMQELFITVDVPYLTSLILSKKLIFTTSYDVYKHFIVAI